MYSDAYSNIFNLTEKSSHRASSWDKRGGNNDAIRVGSQKTKVLADIEGPGIINHIYFTTILQNPLDFRYSIIRMYWDHEENPSVEVPLGDLFGVSNCRVRQIDSLMITINKGASGSYGFNLYFPMPFSEHAKIEIENQGPVPLGGFNRAFWYHIDYDKLNEPFSEDVGYFHAYWNRENPTKVPEKFPKNKINKQLWKGKNITGEDNYVILETEGNGQLAGLLLTVDNTAGGWYGEGDDLIFIDDDTWPPSIHGTGSEEIFGGGASPKHEYTRPYSGFHIIENFNYWGNNGMYRWYVNDPIRFKKRIRWTIEHGHANSYENDYSSVAYWYQKEPHKRFPPLPELAKRIPRIPENFEEIWSEVNNVGLKAFTLQEKLEKITTEDIEKLIQDAANGLLEGRYILLNENIQKLKKLVEKVEKK